MFFSRKIIHRRQVSFHTNNINITMASDLCIVCIEQITQSENDIFSCKICHKIAHLSCLSSTNANYKKAHKKAIDSVSNVSWLCDRCSDFCENGLAAKFRECVAAIQSFAQFKEMFELFLTPADKKNSTDANISTVFTQPLHINIDDVSDMTDDRRGDASKYGHLQNMGDSGNSGTPTSSTQFNQINSPVNIGASAQLPNGSELMDVNDNDGVISPETSDSPVALSNLLAHAAANKNDNITQRKMLKRQHESSFSEISAKKNRFEGGHISGSLADLVFIQNKGTESGLGQVNTQIVCSLHISPFSPSAHSEDILNHLKKSDSTKQFATQIKITKLVRDKNPRQIDFCSFRLDIPRQFRQIFVDPALWPSDVLVKDFIFSNPKPKNTPKPVDPVSAVSTSETPKKMVFNPFSTKNRVPQKTTSHVASKYSNSKNHNKNNINSNNKNTRNSVNFNQRRNIKTSNNHNKFNNSNSRNNNNFTSNINSRNNKKTSGGLVNSPKNGKGSLETKQLIQHPPESFERQALSQFLDLVRLWQPPSSQQQHHKPACHHQMMCC